MKETSKFTKHSSSHSASIVDSEQTNLPDSAHPWITRLLPNPVVLFIQLTRLDRPIGWWLLLLPCWWSATLAAIATGQPYPNPTHMLLFGIGAIVMRSAGCVWNDLVDRDLDAQVERTKNRPLAAGKISRAQAIVILLLLCAIGLAILLSFNRLTIVVGLASIPIILFYPFAKRLTDWPQAVLGLAFNWGALLGWTAAVDDLSAPAVLLFLAGLFWTIGYDTIYACQDRTDDSIAGIRSTVRKFRGHIRQLVLVNFVLSTVFFGTAVFLASHSYYSLIALLPFAALLSRQVITLDELSPRRCLAMFREHRNIGLITLIALMAWAYFSA